MSAVPFDVFVRNEVGKVMEAAVKFTPAIRVARARLRHESAVISSQPASLYAPQSAGGRKHRSRVAVSKNGYIKYFLANRYPNALWRAMSRRRREKLARILGARGLAQKSWYRIMLALGIEIKVPDYVKRARPGNGSDYKDVSATSKVSERGVSIHIVNAQPTVNFPNVRGREALARAIAGRVKYFDRNIRYRVFNKIAEIARAYPGIKTHLNLSQA